MFREVNARIRDITERFGVANASYVVLCECGVDRCLERVEVPVPVYDDVVDRDGGRFLVAPGHERPELDQLVSSASAYSVVEVATVTRRDRRGGATLRVVPTGLVGRAE